MKRHLLGLCIALALGISALTAKAGGHGGGCWGGHGCGGGWCGHGCGWGGWGWGSGLSFGVGFGVGGVGFGVGFGFPVAAPAPVFVQPAPAVVALGVSTPVVRTVAAVPVASYHPAATTRTTVAYYHPVATTPVAYYSRPTSTVVAQNFYTSVPSTAEVAHRYYTSMPSSTVAAAVPTRAPAPTPAQIRSSSGTWVLDSTPYRYSTTATVSQANNSSTATTVVRPSWSYVASR
jgi:hypothetical protein